MKERIVEILKKQIGFCSLSGISEPEINKAESKLQLKFADEYREYVLNYGVASFKGHELTGLSKIKRLNVVDVTMEKRKEITVPDDWYVLEDTHFDGIVIWQNASGAIFRTVPREKSYRVCNSLEEYIMID